MEEPTIVESKRQKKIPPPRPPPPSSHKNTDSSPADRIPRSQTVSGDMPRRPKHPPGYPARRGGSPVLENRKSAGDNTNPVPPPRRRKKQQLIFPESNPNSDVKEGFVSTDSKDFTASLASKEDVVDGERPLMETQERSARSLSIGVRPSTKRKEAQNMAKMKVSAYMPSLPVLGQYRRGQFISLPESC